MSYDGSMMSSKEQTGLWLTLNNDSNYKMPNIPLYPNFFSIPDLKSQIQEFKKDEQEVLNSLSN